MTNQKFLDDIERIVKLARGNTSGYIDSESDWGILVELFKLWVSYYPAEYNEFKEYSTLLQSENSHSKGIVKGKGGSMVQHQLELPGRWWGLVKAIYPNQRFDKKFTKEIAKRFSILNISGSSL